MVKKKRSTISTKLQLLVATGTVLLLVAFGLLVAWLDNNTTIVLSSHRLSFSDVTVKGEPVCLTHKGEGPHTEECALGLKTANGAEYIIKGKTLAGESVTEVTGKLMAPVRSDAYKNSGTIVVE